jgi:hypothetical protein
MSGLSKGFKGEGMLRIKRDWLGVRVAGGKREVTELN